MLRIDVCCKFGVMQPMIDSTLGKTVLEWTSTTTTLAIWFLMYTLTTMDMKHGDEREH